MSNMKKVNISFSKDFIDSVNLSDRETFNYVIGGKIDDWSVSFSTTEKKEGSFISKDNYPLNVSCQEEGKHSHPLTEKSLHTKEELLIHSNTSSFPPSYKLKYGLYDEKNKIYYLCKTKEDISFKIFVNEIPLDTISIVCDFRRLDRWDDLSKIPPSVERLYASFNKFQDISENEFSQTNIKYLEIESCNIQSLTNIHKTKLEIINCEGNPCYEEYKFYEKKLSSKQFKTLELKKRAIIHLIKKLHRFIDDDCTSSSSSSSKEDEESFLSLEKNRIEINLDKINSKLNFGKITVSCNGRDKHINYVVFTHIKVYSFRDFIHEIPFGTTDVYAFYKNIEGWEGLKDLPKSVTNLTVRGNSFENLKGELSETNIEYLDIQSCGVKSLEGIQDTKIKNLLYQNNPCENEIKKYISQTSKNIEQYISELKMKYCKKLEN